jgi:hypothetical protein
MTKDFSIENTIWVDKDTDLGKFINLFDEMGIVHSLIEDVNIGTCKATLLVFDDNIAVAFDKQAKYISFCIGNKS